MAIGRLGRTSATNPPIATLLDRTSIPSRRDDTTCTFPSLVLGQVSWQKVCLLFNFYSETHSCGIASLHIIFDYFSSSPTFFRADNTDGTLAALFLKGLEDTISYSVVHPTWGKTMPDDPSDQHYGWVYRSPGDDPLPNPLGHGANECDDALVPDPSGVKSIRELYELSGDHQGPFTTPVLFDKKLNRIVNNESTEILRILNFDFNDHAKNADLNLYPEEKEAELAKLNDTTIYPKVNNGVYRSGFARSQQAYEAAVNDVFETLEELEQRLSNQRYLSGDTFTWLDLRLFMTLVRFDPVYTTYFKTNLKRIADYPNLLEYVRDIYQMDPVKRAINMKHIKTHYFTSHPHLNTFGIIPISNGPDLAVPSGREKLSM